jgi:hypothetical protein
MKFMSKRGARRNAHASNFTSSETNILSSLPNLGQGAVSNFNLEMPAMTNFSVNPNLKLNVENMFYRDYFRIFPWEQGSFTSNDFELAQDMMIESSSILRRIAEEKIRLYRINPNSKVLPELESLEEEKNRFNRFIEMSDIGPNNYVAHGRRNGVGLNGYNIEKIGISEEAALGITYRYLKICYFRCVRYGLPFAQGLDNIHSNFKEIATKLNEKICPTDLQFYLWNLLSLKPFQSPLSGPLLIEPIANSSNFLLSYSIMFDEFFNPQV